MKPKTAAPITPVQPSYLYKLRVPVSLTFFPPGIVYTEGFIHIIFVKYGYQTPCYYRNTSLVIGNLIEKQY